MAYISVDYDLNLPNEFLVDHSQSEGKTRRCTYNGPDKIWLLIGEDGREKYGPWAEEDKADGRPVPIDATLFEVDCITNPLICQLRAPILNEVQEDYTEWDVPHPQSPVIEGYPQFKYDLPLRPGDVFDKLSVRVIDGVAVAQPWTISEKLLAKPDLLTWDDIRAHRNKMLEGSDSQIAEDMPQYLKDEWMAYRQKLRDLPTVLEAAGVPPSIAYYMFPEHPHQNRPGDQSTAPLPPTIPPSMSGNGGLMTP